MSVTFSGFDAFARDLDPEPSMRRWARRVQERNAYNLQNAIFDESAPNHAGVDIRHNAPYTIRRKGFDGPGFGKTGEMAQNVTAEGNVAGSIHADGGELVVSAGKASVKLNVFLNGQVQPKRVAVLTGPKGQPRKKVEREVRVPARDFVDLDEGDMDEQTGDVLDDVFSQWDMR